MKTKLIIVSLFVLVFIFVLSFSVSADTTMDSVQFPLSNVTSIEVYNPGGDDIITGYKIFTDDGSNNIKVVIYSLDYAKFSTWYFSNDGYNPRDNRSALEQYGFDFANTTPGTLYGDIYIYTSQPGIGTNWADIATVFDTPSDYSRRWYQLYVESDNLYAEYFEKYNDALDDLSDMEILLTTMTSERDYFQHQTEELQNSNAQLESSLENLQNDYDLLYSAYEELLNSGGSNEELQEQYNILLAQYTALSTTYNGLLLEYNTLLGDYNTLLADYNSLLSNYNDTLAELNWYKQELEDTQEDLEFFMGLVEDLEVDNERKDELILSLRIHISALEQDIEILNDRVQEIGGASYQEGYYDGMNEANVLNEGIKTIFSSPTYILSTIFDFELFGVNFFHIIQVICTMAIIGFVIKLFI